jgi:phosphoribosyl-AMP cyclohydrolase
MIRFHTEPGMQKMLKPDFKKMNGLVPVIAQDSTSREVLMLAYMNEEAFNQTLATGEAVYFSRSRQKLWHKGESSGCVQRVKSIRIDCDNDTLVLLVEQIGGAACHTGRRSCFFRELNGDEVTECSPLVFDPVEVYGK